MATVTTTATPVLAGVAVGGLTGYMIYNLRR
jgi:hypothetical protein